MTTADPRSVLHPAYSSPGWDWLKNPPEHWETSKVKHCLAVNESTLPETTDPDLEFRYIEISAVNSGDLVEPPAVIRFSAAPSRARRIVKGGDTIVSTVRTYLKAVWYADDPGDDLICSTGFAVLTPKQGTIPKFASYVAQSAPFTDQVTAESVGIAYPAISEKKLGGLRILVPPLEEQAAIVRFLDHADEQIRRYIASKERLIALLEEERQALVHQAVTRGLDPSVRLKPSGVEWLGDVPEHWEVTRTRFLLKETDRRSTTGNETHLSMSQVLGLVPSHQVEQSLISDSYVGGKLCEEGDLVLNRLKAHIGVFALADQEGVVSPDYSVFRRRTELNMEYFAQVLRLPALRPELRIRSKGIVEGFWRLYTGDLFDIRLPVPPVAEQVSIVDNLSRMTGKLDATIARTRRQINLMNEYRTRLIADVVTGQLDVCEAAAQLPAAS